MPVITSILYLRQARWRSRSMTSKYSSNCSWPHGEVGQLAEFADQAARVGQMVGDADAVETALAVEIHHLRHGQFAVGIIGVDVEIAEQHCGRDGGERAGRVPFLAAP